MSATLTREEAERAVAAWALTQLDVPWVHQARVPGKGMDCVGLLVLGGRLHGFEIVDMLEYGLIVSPEQLQQYMHMNCEPVEEPVPGGLASFWFRQPISPVHVGVMLDARRFVHSYRRAGKVVENSLDKVWGRRVHKFWRYKWA